MEDELDLLVLGAIGDAASEFVEHLDADYAQPGQKISHYRIVERIGEGGVPAPIPAGRFATIVDEVGVPTKVNGANEPRVTTSRLCGFNSFDPLMVMRLVTRFIAFGSKRDGLSVR